MVLNFGMLTDLRSSVDVMKLETRPNEMWLLYVKLFVEKRGKFNA